MRIQSTDSAARLHAIGALLTRESDRAALEQALADAGGDFAAAAAKLEGHLAPETLHIATFANSLAEWSGDNAVLVKAIAKQQGVASLRDVALHFDADKLAALIPAKAVPADVAGATAEDKVRNYAGALQDKLYTTQTSAVMQRLVRDEKLPIADAAVRSGIVDFLDRRPRFDIRTTSIYAALNAPDALKEIPQAQRDAVVAHLKTLQRVQALAPTAEAVPVLMSANLTSAFQVAEMPESTFMRSYGDALGTDNARQVYTNAVDTRIRNEHALMTMRESIRGTGFGMLDGEARLDQRLGKMQHVADKHAVPLNLETLFGSMDYCECDDCLSVYSPASYFVEVLQYLRNNNLDPKNPNTGVKGIAGTPLEKLFRRRPDLGCLELTCENTFTVLPYIDLVNEVMESFLVHLGDYHASAEQPKQATLDVFNVTDETSGELLAQPQHVNFEAYCILKNAVYPFTLPYHQPIDAIRIFLDFLGTSRCELLKTFGTAAEQADVSALPPAQQQELKDIHRDVYLRATDAEFLGLTQEEYIILTRAAFWPKRYFELTQQAAVSDDVYRQKIGVRPVHEYYGYAKEADMLSVDETDKLGLTFVKKQFLPRTGILYTDLVELLKTRSINADFPQGKALELMQSLRFSYRFMQTLVDATSADPKLRYAKLIEFLQKSQAIIPWLDALLHPDPCRQRALDCCSQESLAKDFRRWVYCYFERVGKLIVLEAGEGPRLSVYGRLFDDKDQQIGVLADDGTVFDTHGNKIGNVTIKLEVLGLDGKPLVDDLGVNEFRIVDANEDVIGIVTAEGIQTLRQRHAEWLPAQDTCDLDKVRLMHLDGTPLDAGEYDRMQRFIRLWRKLGWSMDEVDQALVGVTNAPAGAGGAPAQPGAGAGPAFVQFDTFTDDCSAVPDEGGGDCGCDGGDGTLPCPDKKPVTFDITPAFIHQLAAIKELLDETGLPLAKLLTFWADIGTAGEKPLYASLFLTHNMIGLDQVFKADADGNYLTTPAKISDHVPVLMAAFRLKADDITTITALRNLPDALTLANVSALYRHSLLAKVLGVKVADVPEIIRLLGDPFPDAQHTLDLLRVWGKMEDSGFSFRQLNYLIRDHDDPLHPLAPGQKNVLQLTKTLYDGLAAIETEQPDVAADRPDLITDDLVRAKAGLVFDAATVEQIVGLLDGTATYTTNAPVNLVLAIPDVLAPKLKYVNLPAAVPPGANVQLTGILTPAEVAQAKALSANPDWASAIDRAGKQAVHFYNDVLFGVFPDTAEATAKLLAGDVIVPEDQVDPAQPDPNTAPAKRLYFLQKFMPFLRRQLDHRLIVDTLSSACGLAGDVSDALLSNIIKSGNPARAAIDVLQAIKDAPPAPPNTWKGYLLAPGAGDYTFVVTSDTPPAPLSLDGRTIAFPHQQDDPSNVWSSDPVTLKIATLYRLEINGEALAQLAWKTALAPKAAIPASALLPDYSAQGVQDVFAKMIKAAILVNGLSLNLDEVNFLQANGADFDAFDFNAVTLSAWRRLQAYAALRDSLPKFDTTLLDLFAWAAKPDDATQLAARISSVTGWDANRIARLIAPAHLDLQDPAAFRSEADLVKLKTALGVADKIGMDIDRLFAWADPSSQFWPCHAIATDLQKAVRARFDQTDWEQAVQPLNDQLRELQKQALIAYLLVQKDLIDWGVVDADSLFEFFLIDVQMCACMQTSRIKQAISTVQLFVQRCFLGLESPDVPNDALDRERWEWMQKYRVWEANRQVFLYPENWIRPELRDDKSPFYTELESDLLQKDISTQAIEDALKAYLFKVDEVANLKIAGLHLETDGGVRTRLHVFARTRNAPYFFHYRYYDIATRSWYPWQKLQLDVPSYDVENGDGHVTENGCYLVPMAWDKRLIVFYPQFAKKSVAPADQTTTATNDKGNLTVTPKKNVDSWEIKLAWTELRNGKWTQKQVSSKAVYESTVPLPEIQTFEFVPRTVSGGDKLAVDVYRDKQAIGSFHFNGSQLDTGDVVANATPVDTDFHYRNDTIYSLQAVEAQDPPLYANEPNFEVTKTEVTLHADAQAIKFYHPFVHKLLGKLAGGDLDTLFDYYLNSVADRADAYGAAPLVGYNELARPYALYNWETGFHAPMALVDKLLGAQQFDQALAVCRYVFDPAAPGADAKRFWRFPPFREIDAENVLENLFMSLKPGVPNAPINEWRDDPFAPHVVARSRPSAYMKYTVMQYIRILIAYGDYYFVQNTLETVPMAIQCYVLASHIYGARAQKIPKRGKIPPATYLSLLDKWDAFGNAMVELELAFPFSNQTQLPIGVSNGVVGLANVFGFATSLYFCIPQNPQLAALRDTIDDRLFKIRHCEDINGVFRQLPLFEPPIDPGLLVQAAAQGLSLASVLSDLNSPVPNYRFYFLLQKAFELCAELKSLGNAFLAAKEKGDAEALAKLRAGHEASIANLIMEVKKLQLEEGQKSLDALQQQRKGPVSRMQHFLKLIGEDLAKVPDAGADFTELPDSIETPVDDSGLKLISYEKEELDKAGAASDWQTGIGVVETLASVFHALPTIDGDGHPFGVGVDVSWGFPNLANATSAVARGLKIYGDYLSFQSSNAAKKGGFLRQLQDRVLQANSAGYEIKNIDKQILTQQIRIGIAQQDITNQQKQIDNAQEVEDFLRNKYSKEELYGWMQNSLKGVYYQAYTLAYNLAKRAEKVYRFERGLSESNFIQFGYWDAGRDGLLAGERLYIGLKQLEEAYQAQRGYDFEITKPISLRQLDPLALIQLRETGRCEFAVPEVLFDMDYPGHYLRRIKAVAITLPCVVGPYTSLNCTLRLLEHKFRTNSVVKDKNDYPERTDGADPDDRFATTNVPIVAVAVSTGQNDSGTFELNFRDERYLPFEGAGAISKWRLELPDGFRQFDYDTITDVVMNLRYTAVDGGDKLKKPAGDSVQAYLKSIEDLSRDQGLFAAFDLRHDFPNEWYKATQTAAGGGVPVITLTDVYERLPIFTKGRKPAKIQAADVYVFTSADAAPSGVTLTQGGNDNALPPGVTVGSMKSFTADVGCAMDSWQISFQGKNVNLDKLWLVARYTLN